MIIDNLDNIIVAGATNNYPNFMVSLTQSGTINWALSFQNASAGDQITSLLQISDNGIVALAGDSDYIDGHSYSI
jgi:hypothetical protein